MKMTEEQISTMTQRATELLGTPFTFVSCERSEINEKNLKARGTKSHHGKTVNVEVTFTEEELAPTYWMISDTSINMPLKTLGSIQLGDKVVVSDPCYKLGTWCMKELERVRPGVWNVEAAIDTIDSWGERLYRLEAIHANIADNGPLTWEEINSLGVDSGSMSIFDYPHYRQKSGSGEEFEKDKKAVEAFDDLVWSMTRNNHYGLIEKNGQKVGVVCSSGCGDGVYPLSIAEQEGQIVGIRVEF